MALFIKFDGNDDLLGELDDGSIEVLSFSWGMTNEGGRPGGGGGGSGRVNVQDLSFTKHIDKTSPILMLQCATGKHIKKATLSVRKAGDVGLTSAVGGLLPAVQLQMDLYDVLVSGYVIKGEQKVDEERPAETLSLNFSKIEMAENFQDLQGNYHTVKGTWDIKTNKAG